MKTFYVTYNTKGIIVDNERNEAKDPKMVRSHIRDMYVAEEPLEIRSMTQNGKQIVTKADKGDIILTFYNYNNDDFNTPIVIKNAEWKKRVHAEIAREAAKEEEYRVKANLSEACKCCADGDNYC